MNKQIVAIYINETFGDKLKSATKKLKSEPRIYDAIFEYTDYLRKSASMTERCYNITTNLSDRVKCEKCDKILKFKSYKKGYGKLCSKSCKG
jgi:hypothetical protein